MDEVAPANHYYFQMRLRYWWLFLHMKDTSIIYNSDNDSRSYTTAQFLLEAKSWNPSRYLIYKSGHNKIQHLLLNWITTVM